MGYSKLCVIPRNTTMAQGRMDLLRQAVRNMLAALGMPDVGDNKLHDLILHIGHTGKL
jgi:hypothetical protein